MPTITRTICGKPWLPVGLREAASTRKLNDMKDVSIRFWGAFLSVLIFGGLVLNPKPSFAQEQTFPQGSGGPTIDEYLQQWRDAKLVSAGRLKIDGRTVNCGTRPTVINSNFDSWGGAFPGFLILNPKKIN